MARTLYIRDVFGRLGNLLYRFGNVYAHALEHGCVFWDRSLVAAGHLPAFPELRRRLLLRFPSGPCLPVACPSAWHRLQAAWLTGYPPAGRACQWRARRSGFDLSRLADRVDDPKRPWILEGFPFHDRKAVQRQAAAIRRILRPRDAWLEDCRRQIESWRAGGVTLVAIHYRQGDYRKFKQGKYFFPRGYYAKCARRIAAKNEDKRIRFLLFSDHPTQQARFLGRLDALRVPLPANEHRDWILMSMCDAIIAPVHSTFSGWAAFFGQVPIYRLDGVNRPGRLETFRQRTGLNENDVSGLP
ncbi:MAG: hypothetical protein ACFE0O_15295 [Opitutales bacterium]